MSFTQWYEKNFGAAKDVWPRELSRADIDGHVMQNAEYVTAASHRLGVDPLRKPLSALDEETQGLIAYQQPTGSGVIKLSMRLVPWRSMHGDLHINVKRGKGWVVHPRPVAGCSYVLRLLHDVPVDVRAAELTRPRPRRCQSSFRTTW